MKLRGLLGLLLATAILGSPAQAQTSARTAAAKTSQARDWSRLVVATPQGGFRMGNPNAALKLVEFGSITCGHCAEFNAEAGPALRDRYVRSGRVSWEYRPFMIFPTDPGIFMLLSCVGPGGFFAATDHLYKEQTTWVSRLQGMPQAELDRIEALSGLQQAGALARGIGADRLLSRYLPPKRMDACLADQGRMDRLIAAHRAAAGAGVNGTPSFMLNGRLLNDVHGWRELEPQLMQGG